MNTPYEAMLGRIGAEEFECQVPYPMKGTPDRNVKMAAYRLALSNRLRRFRCALEVEFATGSDPKADRLWERAWEHGHATGWVSVLQWYDELATFTR